MGILNGCMTLAMAFAPVVGSYVSLFFHWQGNFVVLLILGLACLTLCTIFIPFRPSNSEASISIREYKVVIQSPKALYYMGTIVLLILSYWVFVGIAPILYMEDLGVPLSEFGFYQGSMAVTFALASFSSGYFIKRFGQRACFIFGMGSSGIFMFLNLLLIFSGVKNPLIITIVVQFLALGIIFPVNILYPLSLDAVPRAKARISALISSSRFILTAVTIQIVSYIYDGTFMFIGLSMFLILGLMFICCFKLFREEKNIFV
jgi:DHA1 family bicyclomycin/chloramphenicol resistance-like MFS transporter